MMSSNFKVEHSDSNNTQGDATKRQKVGSDGQHSYVACEDEDRLSASELLPALTLIKIFKKLDLDDTANAMLACRTFYAHASDNQVWSLNRACIGFPADWEYSYEKAQAFLKCLYATAREIEDRPQNIDEILQVKVPTIAQVRKVQQWLRARDTLIVWDTMANEERPAPNVENLAHSEGFEIRAADFGHWCREFQIELASWSDFTVSEQNLTSVPEEISYLRNVGEISFDCNRLTHLPASMGTMEVGTLVLSDNRFRSVPEVIRQIRGLEVLDLCNNQITEIPPWLFELRDLCTLDFYGNPLKGLPDGILKILVRMDFDEQNYKKRWGRNETDYPKKWWLNLAKRINCPIEEDYIFWQMKNFLEDLSGSVAQLAVYPADLDKRLDSFTVDDINYLQNWLKARDKVLLWETLAKQLPNSRGPILENSERSEEYLEKANQFEDWCIAHQAALSQLTTLDLSVQSLSHLPKEIAYLTGLQELNLSDNNLKTLPKEFEMLLKLLRLNINNNEFTLCPKEICELTQLEELYFQGNKGSPKFRLNRLPIHFCSLENLTILDLSFHEISELPNEFRSSLGKLQRIILHPLSKDQAMMDLQE